MKSKYRLFLKQGNFITLLKPLVKKIGDKEAILLSELISWQDYLIKEKVIKENDNFFCESTHFSESLGYCRSTITKYMSKLQDIGLISMKLATGIPQRLWYTIHIDAIDRLITDITQDTDEYGLEKIRESHNKGRIRIFKDTENKRVKPEEIDGYILNGWSKGTAKIETPCIQGIHGLETPLNESLDNPPCIRGIQGMHTGYTYTKKNNYTNNNEEEDKKIISKLSTDNSAKAEITDNLFDTNEVPENEIINFWNNFKVFTSHCKRTTKTYRNLSTDINKILEGTFDKELNKNWLKDNKLKNIFKHPLSEKELYKLIAKYSKQFTLEYQPENKSKLNKNFSDFIYNPMSKKSQLLYIANYGLKKIGEVSPEVIRKRLPPEIDKIINTFLKQRTPNMSDHKKFQIFSHVESALKFHERVKGLTTSPYIRNEITFFKEWVAFMDGFKEIGVKTFATNAYVWNAFIEHMEKDHSVNLDPDQKIKKVRKIPVVVNDDPDIDEEVDLTSQLYP
jgi:hypothetical protein